MKRALIILLALFALGLAGCAIDFSTPYFDLDADAPPQRPCCPAPAPKGP